MQPKPWGPLNMEIRPGWGMETLIWGQRKLFILARHRRLNVWRGPGLHAAW